MGEFSNARPRCSAKFYHSPDWRFAISSTKPQKTSKDLEPRTFTFKTKLLEILDKALPSPKGSEGVGELTIICVQRHINVTGQEVVAIIIRTQAFHQLITAAWGFTHRHLWFRSHQRCARIAQGFSCIPDQLIPPPSFTRLWSSHCWGTPLSHIPCERRSQE